MGRKSLAEERREDILAAFERCIARYGIDVSLEQIADEAGVKRSLIRHYLGNRDELIDQMIDRTAAEYPRQVAAFIAQRLPGGIDAVLDSFFVEDSRAPDWDVVMAAVANTAKGRYPAAKRRVAQMMMDITEEVAAMLRHFYPQASADAAYEVAYTLVCIVQAHESMLDIGIDHHHTQVIRASAAHLMSRLAQEPGGSR
jgi:AcrR family transcriptional regulator